MVNSFFCRERKGEALQNVGDFCYIVFCMSILRCEFDMIDIGDNINGVVFCCAAKKWMLLYEYVQLCL